MASALIKTLSPAEVETFQRGLVAIDNLTLPDEQKALIRQLLEDGKRVGVEQVKWIWQLAEERVRSTPGLQAHTVWIEEGSEQAGFKHLLKHQAEFPQNDNGEVELIEIAEATSKVGTWVGNLGGEARKKKQKSGSPPARPIYLLIYKTQPLAVAISIGSNGFVVGMNRQSWDENIGKLPTGTSVGWWPEPPPTPDRTKEKYWTYDGTGYAEVENGVVGARVVAYPIKAWIFVEQSQEWRFYDEKGNRQERKA